MTIYDGITPMFAIVELIQNTRIPYEMYRFLLPRRSVVTANKLKCKYCCGARGGAGGGGTALQAGRSQVRFPMVSLKFFIDIILLSALCPWGRLSL
jgi:hypothetical protein